MNFVQFIDNRFQELTLKTQTKTESFDAMTDSEIKALHQILSCYRTVLKYLLWPKCLSEYLLVCLKLRKKPEPVLSNKMKAEQQALKASTPSLGDKKSKKKADLQSVQSDEQLK